MPKPTVIFVPGAWLPKASYGLFLHALEKEGFPVHYASYPSFDPTDNLNASCERDAKVIRGEVIQPLVEGEGRDVVLFMHSYASMPGSAAVSGFSKTERVRKGQAGGVLGLICIGAFLIPQGLSCAGMQGGNLPGWILLDQPEKGVNIADDPVKTFAADVDPDLANQMAAQLKPHSNLAFTSEQPPPAWAEADYDGRCAYIVTGDDQAVPQAAQYGMISGTGKNWIVKEFAGSSHMAPFLTKIDPCIQFLQEILDLFPQA
ncbi:Alpha/beta hydrolase fold-1 [Talaromyces proteolyticus]|uniref:Alpha/beta hydrolase fold-1 n=1 Tax=Talaromyces proteolyticus TaxID=1131652 RepID=A0AAD4KVL7_9EURO|nr:Alpha/beta hydrolase fold-1 [Talaromyces proteolyticus]KAH8700824.1 Alpha/beta hydrolase fold-1 [Talaromyces proteolyticus]